MVMGILDRSDNEGAPSKEKNGDPTLDLKHFFSSVDPLPGSKKGRGQCKLCKRVVIFLDLSLFLLKIFKEWDRLSQKGIYSSI
jgi:hypothetical protein